MLAEKGKDEEPEAAEGGGPRRAGWKRKNWKQGPEKPVTGQKGGGISRDLIPRPPKS